MAVPIVGYNVTATLDFAHPDHFSFAQSSANRHIHAETIKC
jgi:hypothetical protein